MSRAKPTLESKRKIVPVLIPALGTASLSLTLAGGAVAAAQVPTTPTPEQNSAVTHAVTLPEEDISGVSLSTFYVADKERNGSLQPRATLAMGAAGCAGCAGCGGCGGCWTGTYYTAPVFGNAYPPPPPYRSPRAAHVYRHGHSHVRKGKSGD